MWGTSSLSPFCLIFALKKKTLNVSDNWHIGSEVNLSRWEHQLRNLCHAGKKQTPRVKKEYNAISGIGASSKEMKIHYRC